MKLTVNAFVSLDGVMQGPGGPEEDTSNGFDRGGWQAPFTQDEDFGRIVGGWFDLVDEFLLGRTTYDMMYAYWSQVTDPDDAVAAKLNGLPKHVVSTTLASADWQNASLISTNVVESVRVLKERAGGELQVHGSWQLAQTLHNAGLVDEYRLLTSPVVVGAGKRLFDGDSQPSGFTLVEGAVTNFGGTYQVLRPTTLRTGFHVVEDGKEALKMSDEPV